MQTKPGSTSPLGPSFRDNGINIALFSKEEPTLEIIEPEQFKTKMYRTGDIWHVWLPCTEISYRFIINNLNLIDPYSPIIYSDSESYDPISKFSPAPFDWEDDTPPNIPLKDLIIYEMHPRGFTEDPSSDVLNRGTLKGIIEKLPYLKKLGINAIELMPIHEFNEHEVLIKSPKSGELLVNYWGYSSVSFFALSKSYAKHPNDLKELVKACHKEGIEVILDVVYNHTAEGNKLGPTHHFKAYGLDIYYLLDQTGDFQNPTGCGNAIKSSHPIVIKLILDSLHYFVTEYHIDGFRFDLASTFNRDQLGNPVATGILVEMIANDPVLASTKLIAEPWDISHYQVGSFHPSNRFSEWNGRYRDTVRSFIRGDTQAKTDFATRISGSQDLYGKYKPTKSINFLTSHDGFSLRDLVTYTQKRNFDNGENNQDGTNDNISSNYGVEGETDDPEINKIRLRQMKNFMMAHLLSRGVPMLTMGDEVAHTKKGNNNTWCQDNELNWFPWNQVDTSPLLPFVIDLIKVRKKYPSLREDKFLTPEDISWHGLKANNPAWNQGDLFLAYELKKDRLYIAFNASNEKREVELPEGRWEVVLYTGDKIEMGPILKMEPYTSVLLKHF